MLKQFAKLVLTSKAAIDVIKEKIELKAVDLALQVNNFKNKTQNTFNNEANGEQKCDVKEKVGAINELLFQFFNEISHKAQINELQIKGFIKDKLTELTNNALLDSTELNDIRAEIASLRAELADIKSQISLTKTR